MFFKHSLNIHAIHKRNSDRCNLFLLISVNGERKEVPTHITCPVLAYDSVNKRIISGSYPDAAIDNLHLQQCIAAVERAFQHYELSDERVTLLDVLNAYEGKTGNGKSESASAITVREAWKRYYDSSLITKGWVEGTARRHRNNGKLICDFMGNRYINTLTDDDMTAFLGHYKANYHASTLDKHLSDFKAFLREASRMGLYAGRLHETYSANIKGAHTQKEIIFLTQEELSALESYQWPTNHQALERVVDSFLFACFSGLRHSDVYNLKRSNIIGDFIYIRMIKTSKPLGIPLNKHTQRILDKYADYHDGNDHPFPVLTDQKANLAIKEACRIVGIDTPTTISYYKDNERIEETHPKYELVSFHCARRTFCTQAFILGIPADVLIKFTGHTSTSQLRHYMEITNEIKSSSMSLFNNI